MLCFMLCFTLLLPSFMQSMPFMPSITMQLLFLFLVPHFTLLLPNFMQTLPYLTLPLP
jgi:hypothetical protein